MGSKTDTPKPSPVERLARKRAAARLRQQRCRARKRQIMLEKKRGELVRQRCVKLTTTHDPSRPPVIIHAVQQHRPQVLFPTYKSMHSAEASGAPWAGVRGKGPAHQQLHKSPSEPIYACVSFDSPKSLEEAKQNNTLRVSSSPPRSPSSQKSPIVVTPSRTPPPGEQAAIVRVLSEEKNEDSQVSEEEAAVAAMLSLKSGSMNPSEKSEDESKKPLHSPSQLPSHSPSPSPPREVTISHKAATYASSGPGGMHAEQKHHNQLKYHHGVRPQQQRRVVARHFEAYNYGQPMKIPPHSRRAHVPSGYYRVHAPVPPPHPHYARCYYPPAPRYVSYEYE